MKRHSELSERTPERVSKARAGVTEVAIRLALDSSIGNHGN